MLGPREDLATLMLGTASVALAMVMSIVTLMGLRGISFPPWSVPRDVMVKASPPRFTDVYDPVSRRYAAVPKLVSSGKVFVPSSVCCGLAFLGLVLGGIGLAVSLRRRKLSWLSAIGFTLMLLMMAIVIACDTLMTLSP